MTNPKSSFKTIAVTAARAGDSKKASPVAVYDLAGRVVRSLVDGTLPAADHAVVWDGRTGSGRRAASGTYYYRLIVDGEMQTRKMMLVK